MGLKEFERQKFEGCSLKANLGSHCVSIIMFGGK
jgi:hypothetical protein